MKKSVAAATVFVVGSVFVPGIAFAQVTPVPIKPNKNWVFLLSFVVLAGLLAFIAFVSLYYVLAVVARNRKYATAAVAVAPPAPVAAPVAAAPAPVAAPVAAPAPAPAAPAAAPAAGPAAAPAAAPAADTGGLPRIDPNNLPDGIDAVTRGRLKKLAVLQERGQAPPPDLVKELQPILATIGSSAPAAAAPAPAAPAPAPAPAPEAAPAPAPEAAPAPAPAADAPAPAAEAPPPAAEAPAAPAPDTGGLPRIDPNNLPAGIDAVTRGRLKKLAILQERGTAPPADLVEHLKPVLDQMS